MMRKILESDRLRLVPVAPGDTACLHAMWTDRHVRRYLWDDEVISDETARAVVTQTIEDWEKKHYGLWLVYERSGGTPVGFVGFRAAASGEPELLYGLLPSYWGRGYATESATAALSHVFLACSVPSVVAATDAPNAASIRVMERLGMRFQRRGVYNGLDTVFFAMTNEQFRGRRCAVTRTPAP